MRQKRLIGNCGMAMGREGDRQGDLMVSWAEMPRSPGHAFYDRLQEVLLAGGFDLFVETVCQPYYAPKMGAPSVPPGRYFCMHMVGYFEGIASERGASIRLRSGLHSRSGPHDPAGRAQSGRVRGDPCRDGERHAP